MKKFSRMLFTVTLLVLLFVSNTGYSIDVCKRLYTTLTDPVARTISLDCAVNKGLIEYAFREMREKGVMVFPHQLDGSFFGPGSCSTEYPCFTEVLPAGLEISDSSWVKTDTDRYQDVSTGTEFEYDNVFGRFTKYDD